MTTLLNVAKYGTAQHMEKLVRQHRRVLRLNGDGETSLDNLVLLCRSHHRLLREGVFSIEKNDTQANTLNFINEKGKAIKPALSPQFEPHPVSHDGKTEIARGNERLGLAITARTAVTRWRGERMDYGLAIDALMRAS